MDAPTQAREHAREEEVLADVAERPLDFTLRLGPVGGRLKAALDVFADGLAVMASATRDGRDG